MRTVLVTGGTGTFGRQLVPILRTGGMEVRVLSRRDGAGTHSGDLATGRGLEAALDGVDTVIHAASDTRRFGQTDSLQTQRLLHVGRGVQHLLYLSIVGIEAIPYRYYKQKRTCERHIESGDIPWSILRATQFHELIAMVLGAASRSPVALLPLSLQFQSVASSEVASHIAGMIDRPATGTITDFGGPEILTLRQMTSTWRSLRGRPRAVIPVSWPGRIHEGFRTGRNTCPESGGGRRTWAEFVAALPDRR